MALVKFGAMVADARGKVGGVVLSRNRYGNYMRTFKVPVNPNSERQVAVRADMASIVNAWYSVLTPTERAAWGVYAAAVNFTNKLGETITLSGYNQFIRTNISRKNNGQTVITTGPVELVLPGTDSEFDVSISEATQLVTVVFDDGATWCSEDSAVMSISQGVPQNSARGFYGGHFRKLGVIDGDSGSPPTSPQTIEVSFPVAVTQKDWIQGRIQRSDGRLSEPFRDETVIIA